MSTITVTLPCPHCGQGAEVEVEYEWHRATRGSTDGRCGPKLEPDEPAHAEIESATGPTGEPWELTDDQREMVECQIVERMEDGPCD